MQRHHKTFVWGILTGFVITWGYHHFVKPLPAPAGG